MRINHLLGAVLSPIVPIIALAQRPASTDSVPHAGEWAAEVDYGGTGRASLLYFLSRRSAVLVGTEFAVLHEKSAFDPPASNPETKRTYRLASARLGFRRYRTSHTERLRPLVGVGVRGNYSRVTGAETATTWFAGPYVEVGAVYFVAPHVSLGGTSELELRYQKEKQSGSLGSSTATTTTVSGSLARLLVSVYF